jgi:hypothetical protein
MDVDASHSGGEFRDFFEQGAHAEQTAQSTRAAMAACAFGAIDDPNAKYTP